MSREGRMHALIIKNIPEVGGVIHAIRSMMVLSRLQADTAGNGSHVENGRDGPYPPG